MKQFILIEYLLSEQGLKEINEFWNPSIIEESINSAFDNDPLTNESDPIIRVAKASVESEFNKKLIQLLRDSMFEIESRLSILDTEKERVSFLNFALRRFELIEKRWEENESKTTFLTIRNTLNDFKPELERLLGIVINESSLPGKVDKLTPQVHLPDNFKLSITKLNNNEKVGVLNLRQTALLFHYLKQAGAILNHSDSGLAKLIHALTGHSEQNVRAKGLGAIWDIKEGRTDEGKTDRKGPNGNLYAIKELLNEILSSVEKDITKNLNNKKL